jgi:predicted amidophosphoribosyltransferase
MPPPRDSLRPADPSQPASPPDDSSPPAAARAIAAAVPALRELVALVAPPACPSCRAPLAATRLRLCPACAAALPWLPRTCCPRCALPAHRGRRCVATGAAFDRAWSPLVYDGVARELIAALKFRGALPLAELMAAHIAANLPADLRPPAGAVAIVPVPPQPRRRRRRGFDPAGALADGVAERLGVPVDRCLRRRDHAARQVGTGRRARRRPGRLAIDLIAPPPGRLLLLDDVHTTGATLEACAAVLRAGGARHIAAITYARTL